MPYPSNQLLLNKYRVERVIGEGGYGYVYQALDVTLNRRVAIKELKPQVGRDRDAFARFMREARAAVSINHPNIVTLYALEQMGSANALLVMEYMDGGSLADMLQAHRALAPNQAVNITQQMLAALDAIHTRGIVHRDLKPSNILFTRDGRVKLSDFGLARISAQGEDSLTQTGAVLGTVYYMSPEQARGQTVDARSDLFSLGAVLYEMLTGRRYLNFDRNMLVNLEMVKTQAPVPLPASIPKPLGNVVYRSLSNAPRARFQSAREMSAALTDASRTIGAVAAVATTAAALPRAPSPAPRTPSPATRRPHTPTPASKRNKNAPLWIFGSIAIVALILFFGFAFLLQKDSRATPGGNNSGAPASTIAPTQARILTEPTQTQTIATTTRFIISTDTAIPTVTLISPLNQGQGIIANTRTPSATLTPTEEPTVITDTPPPTEKEKPDKPTKEPTEKPQPTDKPPKTQAPPPLF